MEPPRPVIDHEEIKSQIIEQLNQKLLQSEVKIKESLSAKVHSCFHIYLLLNYYFTPKATCICIVRNGVFTFSAKQEFKLIEKKLEELTAEKQQDQERSKVRV